jgi:hypothetical protein
VTSRRGFLAALVLLLALPLAVLGQVLVAADSETTVHVVGAAGFVLLALAFGDVARPRWVAAAGGAAAGVLAAIFVLQALGTVLPDAPLHDFAFGVLGNHPERLALDTLLACFLALGAVAHRGGTRVVGLLTVGIAVAAEVYSIALLLAGQPADASLRLRYLLPLVWLLVASRPAWPRPASAWRGQPA